MEEFSNYYQQALFACLNVFNLGKKFAKPELKSCIEEFEEKLNKFHIERKEQELTAKNAQSHQQKVDSMESITVAQKEEEDEIDESEITEDSEVTDPSTEAETECSPSEPACAESESNSHASIAPEVPLDPKLRTAVKAIKTLALPIPFKVHMQYILRLLIDFAITLVTLKLNVLLDEEKTPG
ncbi:hypothetical protein P3S68_030122 [Capsicum galapagoense]